MKSMKTLLKLLGAVSLITVATSSIVACDNEGKKVKEMNTQVQKDFGFLDDQNKPLIEVTLQTLSDDSIHWESDRLNSKINADNLLIKNDEDSAKAKSDDAANFLVDVLKLKAESGTGGNRKFKHADAEAIILVVQEYLPVINKNSDNSDYVVSGGTVTIYFMKDNKQLSNDYSLNILANNTTKNGIFLDNLIAIESSDFNKINGFEVGQPKSAFPIGRDLTTYFNPTTLGGKRLKNVVDFIKQGKLEIKVSKGSQIPIGNFVKGDTIKIKFSVGEITYSTEYVLTIP